MVTREELYELVWSVPMVTLAKRFEVSGSYLARVCTVLNVPRPERGHWAKLAVGKAPAPEPLPEVRAGDQTDWSTGGRLGSPPRFSRAPRMKSATSAPTSKHRMHGLLIGAKAHFEKTRAIDDGAYLKPYKKMLVDVLASKARLDDAIETASDLFNTFEAAGHRVALVGSGNGLRRIDLDEREKPGKPRDYYNRTPWSPDRPTVVHLGEMPVGLAVIETSEDVAFRYSNGTYVRDSDYRAPRVSRHFANPTWTSLREVPSGRLRIVAYLPYPSVEWSMHWQLKGTKPEPSLLRSIVREVARAVPGLLLKLQEAERREEIARLERQAAHERWKREEDRRRIQQAEKESRDQLARVIQQWSETTSVEQFLNAVEARVEATQGGDRDALRECLTLARNLLGTQDPLDFLRSWRAPRERYKPVFSQDDLQLEP